jgi:hypothetical protein
VLLELKIARDGDVAFDDAAFDMAVIDDTQGSFANRPAELRATLLANLRRVLRVGGRIEVVEGLGSTGLFARATPRPSGYDAVADLQAAGFRPVRVLAEVTSFRFIEGISL